MSLRRKALDASFEDGRRTALAGIPANAGHSSHKDWRFYEWAYHAGYQAALNEAKQLARLVESTKEGN